jgi:glutathione S-transferase
MHKLWQFRLCPLSRAIRLAIGETGLRAELVEEQPWDWRGETLALNPAAELPILKIENGPLLCGWYSSFEFLAEAPRIPGGDRRQIRLLPQGREDRAEARRVIDWAHNKMYREVTREFLFEKAYPLLQMKGGAPDVEILRSAREKLRYHLSYIAFLAYQRDWLAGDEASFADLSIAAQLSVVDYLGEAAWEDFPAAKDWYGRMKSRPTLREILVERVTGLPGPPAHYSNPDF